MFYKLWVYKETGLYYYEYNSFASVIYHAVSEPSANRIIVQSYNTKTQSYDTILEKGGINR